MYPQTIPEAPQIFWTEFLQYVFNAFTTFTFKSSGSLCGNKNLGKPNLIKEEGYMHK